MNPSLRMRSVVRNASARFVDDIVINVAIDLAVTWNRGLNCDNWDDSIL